jgi:endonuclease/exonuclease/phosphatase family metal-dependent hydrolase
VELPRGGHFFQHRVALAATADTPWGPVRLVSAHLSGEPPETSATQVAALRAFVESTAPVRAIVGGDFNATPDAPPIRARGSAWTDLWSAAHPGDSGLTCCVHDVTSPPGAPLWERIDYLWLAGALGVRIVTVERILLEPSWRGEGWLRASDHVGLVAGLEPDGGTARAGTVVLAP